ncbi:Putative uncharacterized protein [Lactococcus lactis subsp. lactis A12]|uniref:Uncharacterized protein n=1 Tax=Lactococcus lactis subsp. lactis A12 TaxID=1137134 RepID=S6FEY2_LACLL|nr:Putative uncharacterized protein [Lactococcus lactis subsp. lactis A12]
MTMDYSFHIKIYQYKHNHLDYKNNLLVLVLIQAVER